MIFVAIFVGDAGRSVGLFVPFLATADFAVFRLRAEVFTLAFGLARVVTDDVGDSLKSGNWTTYIVSVYLNDMQL